MVRALCRERELSSVRQRGFFVCRSLSRQTQTASLSAWMRPPDTKYNRVEKVTTTAGHVMDYLASLLVHQTDAVEYQQTLDKASEMNHL